MTVPEDRAVTDWLRRLHWALAAMPSPEREEIVAEARAHLEDAAAEGRATADVLAGFGPPDAYARRFLDEAEVTRALGGQRSGDLIAVVARRAHRSLVAAMAGVALLALGAVGLMATTLLFMEIQDPVHTGLWWGPKVHFVGQIDDPAAARDLIGVWLTPAAIAMLAGAWILARLALLAAVRTLARKP